MSIEVLKVIRKATSFHGLRHTVALTQQIITFDIRFDCERIGLIQLYSRTRL